MANTKEGSPQEAPDAGNVVEEKVVKFAEQLGWLVGTVQARSEGWLDRQTLTEQVSQIREGAEELLEQLREKGRQGVREFKKSRATAKGATKPSAAPAARGDRGPVDAPGKKHRQPPPSVRGAKHSDERVAKSRISRTAKHQSRRG